MSKGSIDAPKSSAGGSLTGGGASMDEAILECLAELKLLTAANNDATALAMLIEQMEAVCDKLLAANALAETTNTELMALCQKLLDSAEADAEQSAEQLACLVEIKEQLTCTTTPRSGVLTTW